MRRAVVGALVLAGLVTAVQAGEWHARSFGSIVQIKVDAPQTLLVDGRKLHSSTYLKIDEVALVSGVGVMIGTSSPGGNSCDSAPFVLSFPNGRPRLDGPLDTCSSIEWHPRLGQSSHQLNWRKLHRRWQS